MQTVRALPRARADRLAVWFALVALLAFAAVGALIHLVLVRGMSGPTRIRVDGALTIGLVALYVLLLPLTLRASRMLRSQTERLEGQTKQLSALVDQMPAVIWSTDRDLCFTEVHGSALTPIGLDPQTMMGTSLQALFREDDGSAAVAAHRSALLGETVSYEVELNGHVFQASVQPMRSGGRVVGVAGAAFDITDRKHVERSLDRLQRQHSLILDAAAEGIVGVGIRGNATFVNPGAARMLGWDPHELLGRNVHAVFHHSHEDGSPAPVEKCPTTHVLADGEVRDVTDDWFWRKDGSKFSVEYVTAPLREGGKLIGAVLVFRDVTQRRQDELELKRNFRLLRKSHEQRRRLLARLVHAEEEERKRIAADIHDDSLQLMAAVSMHLYNVRRHAEGSEEARALQSLEESVREAIGRLRHLLFELRPITLDREGLAPALQMLLEQTLPETTRWRVEDKLATEPPTEPRTILYRIAREALANVRKHAAASDVVVVLQEEGGGYLVRITDDGRGFAPGALEPQPGHLGVSAMRERAELTGGWLRIESAPGEGSIVEFWVPVEEDAGAFATP
ncbi:MAG: PAS domain S-box protein [Actinomycetota bacterium]